MNALHVCPPAAPLQGDTSVVDVANRVHRTNPPSSLPRIVACHPCKALLVAFQRKESSAYLEIASVVFFPMGWFFWSEHRR